MKKHKIPFRLLAVLLIVALLFTITTACAKKPETPAALLSLGEKYLTELDYENAIVQFLKVIEIEPMNVRAYAALAEIYTKTEQSGKAVELLQQAVDLTGDESLKRTLEELQPPEPKPEPQSSEVPESSSEPEPALTPEQAMLKDLYAQALSMDMDAAMDLFLTPEFIAMVQAAPENERGNPTLEYEGIRANWAAEYRVIDVSFGSGSKTSDGIAHAINASFDENMQILYRRWSTCTYAGGDYNGPYEVRYYWAPSPDTNITSDISTGNALNGYRNGEEIYVLHWVDGRVTTSVKSYVNGIVQVTGPASQPLGYLPIGIDQSTGLPDNYVLPSYTERQQSPAY